MVQKNKNMGFTLVELIVVLVILAILIALLVPALTGYIAKAKKKKIIAEARQAVNAAQTLYSDSYGMQRTAPSSDEIQTLAEVDGTISKIEASQGVLLHLTYQHDNYTVTYCRNYKSCASHDEQYNFVEGSSTDDDKQSDESTYYFTGVDGKKVGVSVWGNIEKTQTEHPYGFDVPYEAVIFYNNNYYWTKIGNYIGGSANLSDWISLYTIPIATSTTTPSKNSKVGDIRYKDGKYQIYAPYSDQYDNDGYWHTLSTF